RRGRRPGHAHRPLPRRPDPPGLGALGRSAAARDRQRAGCATREGVRMSRRDVAVLGGGRSSEHDVSLASAAAVTAALDRDRYRVHPFTIERDGWWSTPGRAAMPAAQAMTELAACDVAIPMLHGPHGEDGTVAGLLELLGVPSA